MVERRFLAWLFGTCLLGALLAALFCRAVDPYLVFGSPRVVGLNDIKTAITQHEPMLKAYQASRSCARTVILGSSRSGVGLDPDSAAWPTAMQPVYNLSVAGTDLDDGLQLLKVLLAHCSAQDRPATLVVLLDFESFLQPVLPPGIKAAARSEADLEQDDRLRQLARASFGPIMSITRLLKDLATALLTTSALADSIGTIGASVRSAGASVLTNGKSSEWLLRQWTLVAGPGALFHQKHTLTARRFGVRHRLELAPDGSFEALVPVVALLNLAERHQLAVRLGVQPSHVTHHELMDALGYWHDFERWKRAVAGAAQAGRERGVDVVAWDFGGYESAFQESVAARGGDRSPMATFWDPVHYNVALGQRICASLASGASGQRHLGAELRPETVDLRNQQVRQDREAWRQAHPDLRAKTLHYGCGPSPCPSPTVAP